MADINYTDYGSAQEAFYAARGNRLLIPEGTYTISGIRIPDDVDVYAVGAIFRLEDNAGAAMFIECGDNLYWKGGTFIDNNLQIGSGTVFDAMFKISTGGNDRTITFDGVTPLLNKSKPQSFLYADRYNVIAKNITKAVSGSSIFRVESPPKQAHFTNCKGMAADHSAIYVYNNSGSLVTDVLIDDCECTEARMQNFGGTGQNGNGFHLYNIDGFVIKKSTSSNTVYSGIRYTSCKNGTIYGNTINNPGDTGIFGEFESDSVEIRANNINAPGKIGISLANGASNGAANFLVKGGRVTAAIGLSVESECTIEDIIFDVSKGAMKLGQSTLSQNITARRVKITDTQSQPTIEYGIACQREGGGGTYENVNLINIEYPSFLPIHKRVVGHSLRRIYDKAQVVCAVSSGSTANTIKLVFSGGGEAYVGPESANGFLLNGDIIQEFDVGDSLISETLEENTVGGGTATLRALGSDWILIDTVSGTVAEYVRGVSPSTGYMRTLEKDYYDNSITVDGSNATILLVHETITGRIASGLTVTGKDVNDVTTFSGTVTTYTPRTNYAKPSYVSES